MIGVAPGSGDPGDFIALVLPPRTAATQEYEQEGSGGKPDSRLQ